MNFEELIKNNSDQWFALAVTYGKNVIVAAIILIVGLWLIGMFMRLFNSVMEKREFDLALKTFLGSLTGIILKILLGITVLGTLGIEMTSFIALLGAAGLAVGMALSGTLQNFAGGVMILVLKPFRIGDFIEAQGYLGTVREILIFNTVMKTPDNKTIIIPNGGLATGSLINYSTEPTRRVDWEFGIAYGDNADKAREVLLGLLKSDDRVLPDPEPVVFLSNLGNSSVDFKVRAWVNAVDYWAVFFAINERVYQEFGRNGLHIPFPQMDVHLHNSK
jgi:small conductance mechanosensitive channel